MTAEKTPEALDAEIVQHQPPAMVDQQAGMIALIERVLLNDDVPIEKLEKMLDMKERLDAAQARKAFDLAISLAKAEIPPIIKSRQVKFQPTGKPEVNYQHEDLAGIAIVVDPILSKFGLSYRYRTSQEGDRISVTCVISHRDGYSEETTLTGGRDESGSKNNFQAVGSAVTYLQRYTLKAALGLAAAHDDDSGKAEAKGFLSEEQFRDLNNLMVDAGADQKFLRIYGVETLEELPAVVFDAAKAVLQHKIDLKAKKEATGV
jgi:hypothetical protein